MSKPQSLLEIIPGLREAIERERLLRSVAVIRLGSSVAGVECRPLTLLDVVRHDCAGSPFIRGGLAGRNDVFAFLKLQRASGMKPWIKSCVVNWRSAAAEIDEFVEEAFLESPPTTGGEGVPYWSMANSYIHVFGSKYGWSATETLNTPIALLFSQLKVLQSETDRTPVLFNPLSDKVRGEWMREDNRN